MENPELMIPSDGEQYKATLSETGVTITVWMEGDDEYPSDWVPLPPVSEIPHDLRESRETAILELLRGAMRRVPGWWR